MNYIVYRLAGTIIGGAINALFGWFRRRKAAQTVSINAVIKATNVVITETNAIRDFLDVNHQSHYLEAHRNLTRTGSAICKIRNAMTDYHTARAQVERDPTLVRAYSANLAECGKVLAAQQQTLIEICRRYDICVRNNSAAFQAMNEYHTKVLYRAYKIALAA